MANRRKLAWTFI